MKALQRAGFQVDRQSGSHIILKKEHLRVVVPNQKVIKPGTLRNILGQAALSLEEFQKFL